MSLLRWHTPTPAAPANKPAPPAPPPPTISVDRLASLMKQTHYQSPRWPDDVDIQVAFRRDFPGKWIDAMAHQPMRYIYQMLAELVLQQDPNEAQELVKQLSPPDRTQEPSVDHCCGAESVRDHMGADNIVRHMHRNVASASNRGAPIIAGDPYLGTGLNPAHMWGVVSPNDGALPEMACCGQPFERDRSQQGGFVAPPGCWIRLVPAQPEGKLVRYQTWFTTNDPADLWGRIVLGGNPNTLLNATQTGTAFVNAQYYQGLDTQIRSLVQSLAPVVFNVYRSLLDSGFTLTSGFAQLNKQDQDGLKHLVALVQRYNAPQMGACHRERTITADYLDEHVFFIGVGREELRAGRLVVKVDVGGGYSIPLVATATFDSFEATADSLQRAGAENTAVDTFRGVASLITNVEAKQQLLGILKRRFDNKIEELDKGFANVSLTNVFSNTINTERGLYVAAEKLLNELKVLLAALPKIANEWIREKNIKSYPGELVQARIDAQKKLDELVISPGDFLQADFSSIFEASPGDIAAVIREDTLFGSNDELRLLTQVQVWARATVVSDKLKKGYKWNVREKFDLDKAIGKLRNDAVAAVERLAAEKARQEEARRIPVQQPELTNDTLAAIEESEEQQRLQSYTDSQIDIQKANVAPFVRKPDVSIIHQGLVYENFSCAYDTLFAALFMIPNQWFRNHIAETTTLFSDCPLNTAEKLHGHIVQVIEHMEQHRVTPLVCPVPQFWDDCMHTRPVNRKDRKDDEPWKMINSLFRFYGVSNKVSVITFNHGDPNWVSSSTVTANDNVELIIIRPRPTTRVSESLLNGRVVKYTVRDQLVGGRFTLTSCIMYTAHGVGHYEVAVRDPISGEWFRFNPQGKTRSIGKNPPDIQGTISDGPYQPVYWFYVRTERITQFGKSLGAASLDWNTDWMTPQAISSLRPLFGSELRGTTVVAPVSTFTEFNNNAHQIGVMQILHGIEIGTRDNLVSSWVEDNPTSSQFIGQVNDIIRQYLIPLISERKIGNSYFLSDLPSAELLRLAKLASMAYFDNFSQSYTVPYLNGGAPVYIGADGNEPAVFYPRLAQRWSIVLRILLLTLLKDQQPSLEKAKQELNEHITKFGDFNGQIKK